MTTSTEQFGQAFREEAREILVDLEAALLELNEQPENCDLVGRIFRGLHTVKGSGAMFGFDRLAAFAHSLENAFVEVRNGRLAVSAELIDLTLEALDHLKALLEESSSQDDSAAREVLLGRLRSLALERQDSPPDHDAVAQPPLAENAAEACREQTWKIHFAPGPQLMRSGSDPLSLLQELSQMGALEAQARMDSVPSLAELDPEQCYIEWELMLRTRATRDAIHDVFIFVEDSCELVIEPIAEAPAESDRIAKALAEKRGAPGGRRAFDPPDGGSSIRVAAAKLDQFVNLVGELVTVQARLSELAARRDDLEVRAVAEEVERLSSALRENSMNARMMPIRGTFEKFRRLVHDLARDLGKDVELTIEGADTELDKTIIDQLSDPLMHLIRNCMDHGIGSPAERARQGKPALGTIHLSARYSGASVLIGVSDDGRGINAEAVRARAVERALIAADAQLTEAEVFALIFEPGFSTAAQVTDISGRGVGMDVVRRNVDRLRGSIDVISRPGEGTTVTLRLPLTLAIIDGLLVTVGDTYFVLPLACTLECIEMSRKEIDAADGKHLINVRGEVVPYVRLRERFLVNADLPAFEQVMLVDTEEGHYGLVVDRVLGNCQAMIKSLGRFYRHVSMLSGATILGNGTVALILDPHRLVQECIRDAGPRVRGHPRVRRLVSPAAVEAATAVL